MAKPPKKVASVDLSTLPLEPESLDLGSLPLDLGDLPLDPEPTQSREPNKGFLFEPSVVRQSRKAKMSIDEAVRSGLPSDAEIDRVWRGVDRITDPRLNESISKKAKSNEKKIEGVREAQQDTAVREQEIQAAGLPGSGWLSRTWRSIAGNGKPETRTLEEMAAARDESLRAAENETAAMRRATAAVTYPLKGVINALDYGYKNLVRAPVGYAFNLANVPESPPDVNRAAWAQQTPATGWIGRGLQGFDRMTDKARLDAAREMSAEDFADALVGVGEEGGARGAVASALTLPGRAAGVPVGLGLGVPMAAGLATTEVPSLAREYAAWPWEGPKTTFGEVGSNLADMISGTVKKAQNVGVNWTLDPTNAIMFGSKSAAQNAMRSVLAKTGDEALAKAVGAALTEHAGTWRQTGAVLDAFKNAGANPAVAEEIWGPGLRHLGQGQLEVGVPFTNISKPVDTQYAFRQWLGQHEGTAKAVDTLARGIGANPVFDRSTEFAHAIRRSALAYESKIRSDLARELTDGIRALPETARKNWLNKTWRDELYRRAIEPDFTRERGFASDPPLGPGQVSVRNADKHAATGGQFHRLTASSDFVPYSDLDATFGDGTQQLVDLVKRVQERARQGLVDANYMDANQVEANPISGIYMRRPLQSKHGLLDEIIVSGKERSPRAGANALRQSRVGADDGLPGGLSVSEKAALGYLEPKSTDPAELAADYVRLAARSNAETRMRQEMAEAFGRRTKEIGDDSGKNVNVGRYQIPAKQPGPNGERVMEEFTFDAPVANIMDNAFAPAGGQLSRLVRSMIPGASAPERALIKGSEVYDNFQSWFKSNVLKSPAYQTTNYYNDTLRDALEGNINPLAEQALALDMMRGLDNPVEIAGKQTTMQEELRGLRDAGIPFDLEASHRFEIDPGKGLAGDLLDAARDPSAARTAYRAFAPPELGGNPTMRNLGEKSETMQKLATANFWRKQGASFAEAVARAANTKIDYQWRTPLEQALAPAVPFAKFMVESPKRTIRTGLRRPGTLGTLDDWYNAFDENEEVEPRLSIQESKHMRLSPESPEWRATDNFIRETGNALDFLVAGDQGREPLTEGIPAGFDPIFRIKDDTFDSMRIPSALAQGNFKPLGEALTPALRFPIEALTGTVLATGRDQDPPTLGGLAPYGSVFPAEVQANKDQMPWASTYLPNYVPGFDRGYQTLANIILGMNQDQGPLTTFGGSREYVPDSDRRRAYALQIFNYLFPGSMYLEDPASRLQNAVKRGGIDAALKNNAAAQESWDNYFDPDRPR